MCNRERRLLRAQEALDSTLRYRDMERMRYGVMSPDPYMGMSLRLSRWFKKEITRLETKIENLSDG